MSNHSFTTAFTVEQSPEAAYAAINNVRAWWTGDIEGSTDRLGAEFTYRYQDLHFSRKRITELIPGRRVAWRVLESELSFVKDRNEWDGTEITFDIAPKGDKTEVRFTHHGLVPADECYDDCSNAWGSYINGSLRNLIATGKT